MCSNSNEICRDSISFDYFTYVAVGTTHKLQVTWSLLNAVLVKESTLCT